MMFCSGTSRSPSSECWDCQTKRNRGFCCPESSRKRGVVGVGGLGGVEEVGVVEEVEGVGGVGGIGQEHIIL